MKWTIIQHIQLTTESKILLVGWHKLQTNTLILIYIDRIVNIEMIEWNSCRAYWRRKTFLKEVNMIIIKIDILKEVLHNCIQSFTRLYKFWNTLSRLSQHDIFLITWTLTIKMLRKRFIYRDWKNKFVIIRTSLHLVKKPRSLLKHRAFKFIRCKVINSHCHLLILIILIVIMVLQMGLLLRSNNTPHQLYCWIILTRILMTSLSLHNNPLKLLRVSNKCHLQLSWSMSSNLNITWFITNCSDSKLFTHLSCYGEMTIRITWST